MMVLLCVGCARSDSQGNGEAEIVPAQSQTPQTVSIQTVTTLILSSGEKFANPTDEDIRRIISELDTTKDPQRFAILERGDGRYVEVTSDMRAGFILERQHGDSSRRYQLQRNDLSLDEAAQVLIDYRDRNADWEKYGKWTQVMLD